jgi:hypothetical protein
MIKRILAVILIMFSMVSLTACSEPNEPVNKTLSVTADDVALLTLFSDNGKGESNWLVRNYGHSFVAVSNVSDNAFAVGDMVVNPGETITVGLWSVFEHFGVWYNIESNYIKEHNKYAERVSITIGMSMEDITAINEVIKEKDAWTPIYNCSKFALDVWNRIATDNEKIESKFFMSPGYLVDEIKEFEGYENVRLCETSTTIRYYGEV